MAVDRILSIWVDRVKFSDHSIDILGTREVILKRQVAGYNEKKEGRNSVQKAAEDVWGVDQTGADNFWLNNWHRREGDWSGAETIQRMIWYMDIMFKNWLDFYAKKFTYMVKAC